MKFHFNEQHDSIRETKYWLEKDRDVGFPRKLRRAVDVSWLGICPPEAFGGSAPGATEARFLMLTMVESGASLSGASSIYVKQSLYALACLVELASQLGQIEELCLKGSCEHPKLDLLDHAALHQRLVEQLQRGETRSFGLSMLKITGIENRQEIWRMLVDTDGSADTLTSFDNAQPSTICGGSCEILSTIL